MNALRVCGQMIHQQDQGLASMREELRGVSEQYENLRSMVSEQFENLTKAVQALTGSAPLSPETPLAAAQASVEATGELAPLPPAVHVSSPHLGVFLASP